MKNYLKIFSVFFFSLCLISCDFSNDKEIIETNTYASYTFVRESEAGKITFINASENADTFLWEFGDNTTSTVKNPVKVFTQTGDYVVKLTASNSKTGQSKTFSSTISLFIFQGGMISNGNFESGVSPWLFGVANPMPTAWLATSNGNTYASVNVTAVGNPYDVNISQKGKTMTSGKTYRLTFDAWSSVNRPIIVGIGLSGDPWTNQSVSRNITTSVQNFSVDLVANFTSTDARVIFDLGAAVGSVNIDNVTLNQLP